MLRSRSWDGASGYLKVLHMAAADEWDQKLHHMSNFKSNTFLPSNWDCQNF